MTGIRDLLCFCRVMTWKDWRGLFLGEGCMFADESVCSQKEPECTDFSLLYSILMKRKKIKWSLFFEGAVKRKKKTFNTAFVSVPNACRWVAYKSKMLFNNVKSSQKPARETVHCAGKHMSVVRSLANAAAYHSSWRMRVVLTWV